MDAPWLKLPDAPALFLSAAPADDADIAEAAAAFAARLGDAAHPARMVDPAAAPLLANSPEGAAFHDAPATGRAFALGVPEEICPARATGTGADGAQAARAALGGCRAQLDAAQAADECGCALLAVNDALTAPQQIYSYAPGDSARIDAPAFGLDPDLTLIARESPAPGGARRIDFSPAPGDRLSALIEPDGRATVFWRAENGETVTLEGRRIGDGLRRGRYAERIFAADPQGRRISILIGYEPVEYAMRRRELSLWPSGA